MFKQLAEVLYKQKSIYAIIDAARSKEAYNFVNTFGVDMVCLYKGKSAIEMAEFAPYLVAFRDETELSHFFEMSWGKSWGIVFSSRYLLADLREFFRQFLLVDMPNGKKALFRFYDPRVFRDAFPEFNNEEQGRFCDLVDSYFVESSCAEMCLVFGRHHSMCKVIQLNEIDDGVTG